jgi:MSHA biogenesis protein MshK
MKTLHLPCLTALLWMSLPAIAGPLADPTRPPQGPRSQSTEARSSVRVEAILHSDDRRLAIVNGKVVRAGDHVSGVRIEEILVDGVRYMRDGRSQVVRLRPAAMTVRQNAPAESGK